MYSGGGLLDTLIASAYNAGIVLTAAAGNSGSDSCKYPAYNQYTIAVGASAYDGDRWGDSNHGWGLDVVAPGGENLLSLDKYRSIPDPVPYYGWIGGTSASTAVTTGVVGLILNEDPTLDPDEVKAILCRSAVKIAGYNFNETKEYGSWNTEVGYGRVNAFRAIQYMQIPSAPTLSAIQGSENQSPPIELERWG